MSVTTATTDSAATRFAGLSTSQARAVLAAFVLLLGVALWKSPTPPVLCDVRVENERTGDVFLYMTEVRRIHASITPAYASSGSKSIPATTTW